MTEVKMGLKHVILQRVHTIRGDREKSLEQNEQRQLQAAQQHVVTDFSIKRILSTCPPSRATFEGRFPVIEANRILDLSKNSAAGILPHSVSYHQSFHSDFLAVAAATAQLTSQAKFYSQFFPIFPPPHNYVNLFPFVTSSHLSYESSATSCDPATRTTATANAGEVIRPEVCARDCPDCNLYFKQFQYKYPTFSDDTCGSSGQIRTINSNLSADFNLTNSMCLGASSMTTSQLSANSVNFNSKIDKSKTKDIRLITASSSRIVTTTTTTTRTTAAAAATPTADEMSFKCRICDKVFGCPLTLQSHEKTHKSPRYECLDCGKGFSQLRNYKYHISVHRGTKEFAAECPECGKTFNDKGYLSSHMKIHRNKKEYECPYCPKSFNQRVAFNMHVRIHTGVKPHKCIECGKRFSRKMLLKQHMRTHSGEKPYQCAVCGKSFADRSNMTLHHRLHSGIKPFSCPICPKAFTKKHHLKTHLNYHTGCKPYICPHPNCNQAFTQSSNMRTHAKKCQYKPLSLQFPVICSNTSSIAAQHNVQNSTVIRMLSTTPHHSQQQQQQQQHHQKILIPSMLPF